MKNITLTIAWTIVVVVTALGQTPTPAQVDGGGGTKATAQTRPPDNRRPRGTAVGLCLAGRPGSAPTPSARFHSPKRPQKLMPPVWRSSKPRARICDYRLGAEELAKVKTGLAELGLRIPAYRIESMPTERLTPRKLLDFAKALEIEVILCGRPADLPGIAVAVEDARGVYKQGQKTVGANLHDAAKAASFLLELSRQQPPEPPEWPNKCGDCATSRPSVRSMFFTIDPGAAENYDKAVRVAKGIASMRSRACCPSRPPKGFRRTKTEDRRRRAAPGAGQAKDSRRKLLIIDVCPAGGFYHTTIAHGNLMLQLIAKYTGAYEPIFDNNLDNLKYPRIRHYDAVFLNSVVGPVFSDPEVLDGLHPLCPRRRWRRGPSRCHVRLAGHARVRRADGCAGRSASIQRRAGDAQDR